MYRVFAFLILAICLLWPGCSRETVTGDMTRFLEQATSIQREKYKLWSDQSAFIEETLGKGMSIQEYEKKRAEEAPEWEKRRTELLKQLKNVQPPSDPAAKEVLETLVRAYSLEDEALREYRESEGRVDESTRGACLREKMRGMESLMQEADDLLVGLIERQGIQIRDWRPGTDPAQMVGRPAGKPGELNMTWSSPINPRVAIPHSSIIAVGIDKEGKVNIVWSERWKPQDKARIKHLTLELVGEQTKPVTVHEEEFSIEMPKVSVDSRGIVHAVWYQEGRWNDSTKRTEARGIAYAFKRPDSSWATAVLAFETALWPVPMAMTADTDGTLHLTWVDGKFDQLRFYHASKMTGRDWDSPSIIGEKRSPFGEVVLVSDGLGGLHLASVDENRILYFNRSEQGIWMEPQVVYQGSIDFSSLAMSVDQRGSIHIAFSSGNNIFYQTRKKGANFGPPGNVSKRLVSGRYPQLASSPDGTTCLVWSGIDPHHGIPFVIMDSHGVLKAHGYVPQTESLRGDLHPSLVATRDNRFHLVWHTGYSRGAPRH